MSQLKWPSKEQLKQAESKAANMPLRASAMYLREQGISQTKKKSGLSLNSFFANSAADDVCGGRGGSVSKYCRSGAMGTASARSWSSESSGFGGEEPMEIEEMGEGDAGKRRRPKVECIVATM
jgi:hypothetical protein